MFSLDEDDEGEVSFGESSDAEREMTPEIPTAPSVKTFDNGGDFEGASDVDSGTLRAFVVAVIYANAAVLLVALGPMLWFFEGRSRLGPALFVAGLLAGVRTYQTYRSWERSKDAAESNSGGDEVDDESDPDDVDVDNDGVRDDADNDDPDADASPPEA
ncbi:hypothetical protein [Halorubrum sp. CSM-61]|uniref:DUF7322 domain-containing protein n=1 Tax=Halorubrum sp. CSM-61 TaxID=2485838 RepID=UPI000F4B1B1C|nr:hypothetical protein [Halorubrum sp. CSM-61]